jgi:hypothetical protein
MQLRLGAAHSGPIACRGVCAERDAGRCARCAHPGSQHRMQVRAGAPTGIGCLILPYARRWTGTRQFLRFMRAYSADVLGMHLNAHGCAPPPGSHGVPP